MDYSGLSAPLDHVVSQRERRLCAGDETQQQLDLLCVAAPRAVTPRACLLGEPINVGCPDTLRGTVNIGDNIDQRIDILLVSGSDYEAKQRRCHDCVGYDIATL